MITFISEYVSQMYDCIKHKFSKEKEEDLKKIITDIVNNRIVDVQCEIINNYKVTETKTTLVKLIDRLLAKTVIVTGEGSLYRPDSTMASKALLQLLALRKLAKNKALEYKKNKDFVNYRKWNVIQNVYKLLVNSYYGLLGARSSLIYNKFLAASVTSTARTFITSVIMGFEDLTNNLLFFDINDFYKYASNVHKYLSNFESITNFVADKEVLINRYLSKFKTVNKEITLQVKEYFNNITDNNILLNFYYKNNLYEYLKIPIVHERMIKLFDNDYTNIFLYMDNPLSKMKTDTEIKAHKDIYDFFKYIADELYIPEYHSNRIKKLDHLKRENILLTDTDSVFLYLNKFNRFCRLTLPNYNENNALNLFIFMGTRLSEIVIGKLAVDRLNIPKDLAPKIALKNEFIFSRVILTKNRRQYVAKGKWQEGRRLPDDIEPEIKGLTLKKSSLHKRVRTFYNHLIQSDLLDPTIDFGKLFTKLFTFRDEMYDDIVNKRSTDYCGTLKLNNLNAYANPDRMPVVRGTAIWNKLYPNDTIQSGEKCGAYKLIGLTKLKDLDKIPDLYVRNCIKEAIFDDPALAKKGANVICFPKGLEKYPEWLSPFIKVESIINDNMSHIIILLESFRLKTITEKGKKHISNIVEV